MIILWSRCGLGRRNMRKKSSKLSKLEKNRYSVFFYSLSMCCACGGMNQLTKHELFSGRNRQNSMKYGFVIPLCERCHRQLQEDKDFTDKWHKKAQKYFESHYGTREEFLEIFRRNYL